MSSSYQPPLTVSDRESVVPYRLQVMADRLVEHFVSAGLMVREWDRVKLHGTVMNTLFRKDSTGRGIYTLFYIIGSHCALVSCY